MYACLTTLYCDLTKNERNEKYESNGIFKNQSLKWSDRIDKVCANVGIDFTKTMEADMKKYISSNLFVSPIKQCLTDEGYTSVMALLSNIKRDLKQMVRNMPQIALYKTI